MAAKEAVAMAEPKKKKSVAPRADAESMAARQRDISVSEFFAKNRHLLGFDNPRKAMLTTVKEAVDNSLDACEEAGILPEIAVIVEDLEPGRPATAKSSRYRVTIIDNGPGIDPDAMQSIFEPFTQSKRTARNAKDGAGLGLAIVRRCARLLGGDVSVVNRNGGGAAFTLEICAPVVAEEVAEDVVEEVAEEVAEEVVADWTQEIAADDAVSTPQVPEPSSEASPETRPEPSRAPRSPSSFMPMGASILPPPTPVQGVLPFSVTDDDFGALYRAPREERAIRTEPTAEAVVVQPQPEPVASPAPTPTPSMPAAPRRTVHARKLHAQPPPTHRAHLRRRPDVHAAHEAD